MKQNPTVPGGHEIALIRRDSTGPKPDVANCLAQELITRDMVADIETDTIPIVKDPCKAPKRK